MKCPECEATGQRSKFYMPTSWWMTAAGGSQNYYDEVNRGAGSGHCSEGHNFTVYQSTSCRAAGCDYGSPESMELLK